MYVACAVQSLEWTGLDEKRDVYQNIVVVRLMAHIRDGTRTLLEILLFLHAQAISSFSPLFVFSKRQRKGKKQ